MNYVYRTDIQGNVIALLDSSGEVVVQYKYDAWGNQIVTGSNSTLGNLNPFRYRSYYYDTETGLYYLQTRYYDPEVGRFLNIDSLDYADPETINGLNLYAYCNNNPILYVDPTGHAWWHWLVAAAVVVAAVVVSVATAGVAATVIAGTAGAAIGVGTELTADLIDDGQINRGIADYVGSAVGGFVSGLGGNILSSAIFGGAGDLTAGLISGEINSFGDALHTFGSSAVTSGLLASGGKAFSRGIAKNHYNKIIGNSTKNIKINGKLKQAGFGKAKIGKDGLEAVLAEISNSTSHKAINGVFSNTLSFGVGLLKEVF